MKKQENATEVLNATMIDFYEESITKKDLLKKLQEALDNFTECETLHSITLRAIVNMLLFCGISQTVFRKFIWFTFSYLKKNFSKPLQLYEIIVFLHPNL